MSNPVFLSLDGEPPDRKAPAMAERVHSLRNGDAPSDVFTVTKESLQAVPGSPFAYWTTDVERALFRSNPALESDGRAVQFGASTKDDTRYLRLWVEVASSHVAQSRSASMDGRRWVSFAKGGEFGHFHRDWSLVVDWAKDGKILKEDISQYRGSRGWGYQWSAALNGHSCYFRPGLTWSRRTQAGLSVRALPAGCIFGDKGPAVFVADNTEDELYYILGVLNSAAFRSLVELQMAFGSYEVGVLSRTPLPRANAPARVEIAELSRRSYELVRSTDLRDEFTHCFAVPALTLARGNSLTEASSVVSTRAVERDHVIAQLKQELDSRVAMLYGLPVDRPARLVSNLTEADPDAASSDDVAENDVALSADGGTVTADLLSWCIGVVFGRWDVRMADDASLIPALQGPFDCLPRVAPGGLVGPDGLPATEQAIASESWLRARPNVITLPPADSFAGPAAIPAAEYPVPVAWDGVLVDDEGHARDLVAAVRRVLAHVYGDRADAVEAEALALLRGDGGSTPRTLRDWFRNARAAALGKPFFDYHIGRYSKSRRKAPIYWRLAAKADAPYTVWLYYPRLTPDTLWRVLGDYVTPRRALAERQLPEAKAARDAAPTGPARRRAEQAVAEAVALLESVQALEAELRRVAERGYAPDLDDGVVISAAPLHRVIPWKEPAAVWQRLEAGDYDWAKLAMALWPDRVRAKCEGDRSLAIAHGLA